jgi:hydroxymethylglutaryl-CoA reductase (NADPH)
VGDPVISKWIVIILCVSMGLNAWLLNAASRGAMQPLHSSSTKPTPVENFSDKVTETTPISQPTISINGNANVEKEIATFIMNDSESDDDEKHLSGVKKKRIRSVSECLQILADGRPQELLDEEAIALTMQKKIPLYALEKTLKDLERAVKIRRAVVCIYPHIHGTDAA